MKDKISKLRIRHTHLICILLFFTYEVVIHLFSLIIGIFSTEPVYNLLYLSNKIFRVGVSFCLLVLIGNIDILKNYKRNVWHGFFVGGFITITSIISLISNIEEGLTGSYTINTVSQIVIFLLYYITTAMTEEIMFRGVLFKTWKEHYGHSIQGVWLSVIYSSILFGAVHIMNIFYGVSINNAIYQSIDAFAIGTLLTAIYLRTSNIWVVIILHSLNNICSGFLTGFFNTKVNMVAQINNTYGTQVILKAFIVLGITLYLLRKSKIRECLNY